MNDRPDYNQQRLAANQAQAQFQNDPCSHLRKQFDEAMAVGSKLKEDLNKSNIEILELKVEVAQLKLQLAKVGK